MKILTYLTWISMAVLTVIGIHEATLPFHWQSFIMAVLAFLLNLFLFVRLLRKPGSIV